MEFECLSNSDHPIFRNIGAVANNVIDLNVKPSQRRVVLVEQNVSKYLLLC